MNELQWTNETHVFIKIYLFPFILERGTQFVVSLRDRWRDIYSERELLLALYILPGARGCQRLHPLASCIVRDVRAASDRLRIPGSTPDSDWTECLNLTTWFSYRVVSFRLHSGSTGLFPVYLSQRDSLSKPTRPPGTNPKSMSTVII